MYLNPYAIFEIAPGEEADTRRRLEAQWEVDLRIDRAPHFKYEGQLLTLAQIRQLLDDLADTQRLALHRMVLEDVSLFRFINFGHPQFLEEQRNLAQENPTLWAFVAPYCYAQYGELLADALKATRVEELQTLLEHPLHTAAATPMVFEPVLAYIRTRIVFWQELQLGERLRFGSEREIVSYLPKRELEALNALPPFFDSVRDAFGQTIVNAAYMIESVFMRKDARQALLKRLRILNFKQKVRVRPTEIIEDSDSVEQQVYNETPVSIWKSSVPRMIIIGLLVVAFLFLLRFIEQQFM